jgi:competence protein ComFC
MTIRINVQSLAGPWRGGWALDLHTLATPPPATGYQRTELGKLLFQLKYRQDRSKIEPLAEIAVAFLKTRWVFSSLAGIIPVPPSKLARAFQPVQDLAVCIAEKINLPCRLDYLKKTKATVPLKNLEDAASRKQQLAGAFVVKDQSLAGKRVLVFDDLYRSGETLKAITETLYTQGKLERVYVLAVTKTRKKR